MADDTIDILMITYNRPEYTELSLKRLLETCDESMRVWIWHNGEDEATLRVAESFASHPRVAQFRVSKENQKLNVPTNWMWENATGAYVAKVDDDCLVPHGWARTLRQAHEDFDGFGAISCWHYMPEDFLPEVAGKKIQEFPGGHRLMRNCFIGGSGYLIKRATIEKQGLIGPKMTFTDYGLNLTRAGLVNGWYYPFLYQEHMDDPRTENTGLKTEADFQQRPPLTAINFKIETREGWIEFLRADARSIQQSPLDPRHYSRWRFRMRRIGRCLKKWGLSLPGTRSK